ncbi:YadA-like family protein [Gallibacterium genomosp. 1]|uniref:YadA-like family protein n=1 Tax=Gallibacterium genomosp. 1 TaxID=155515 RepID=UPI0008027A59|nr:YadA-like family protein [Gallibacterium genomosp. 1]
MRQGGGQRRSSVAGSIVIGAGETNNDAAYVGKDGQHPAGNNGTVVGRTAIGWSTGDTAYGAFSNAKGSSVLNSNFGLADSFDSLYAKSSGEAFHLITNSNNKLSSNKGGDNVALGFKSSAFGLQSVSLGMKSIASGTNALSVGTRSVARDSYSVAIGSESKGMGEASVAMGTFSNALGNYQLDFAKFNDINNDGYSTITQPEQTYQTSNGSGSLKDNSSKYQLITSTLKTGTDGSTTMESKITAQNTSSNKEDAALGVKAIALGDRSASVGVKTIANGTAALALGTESVARTNYAIAQGYQAKAWEEGAIAIGKKAKANAENAIVLGNESSSQSQNALVLGNNSSNQSQNGVVIGNNINLKDSYNDSVVIGNNSTVATNGETRGISSYSSAEIGGLTYGGFTGTPTSVFSIGPAGGRTLQHVAAGKLSADSMDAVNGSQLYRTNLALGNLATTLVSNLGGNAAVVKTNGDTLGQLSFSNIGGTQKNTVHEAIKTIAESTIKLEGNNGSTTDEKNRKTNSSFGIKGASGGGITTTASGSDVSISLDKTTKDTLAKVDQMETKVTQLSSGKADTELSNLTNAGKSVITGLVDVKSSSTALTVSSQTDQTSQKKTFNLALNEDGIKELAGTKTLANDISTAKTEAIKDAKSYTDGKLGNTSLTAVNGNNNTAPTTITQAISQITNAVNSGWEIQQGSTKKGDIGAGKKVNFANGDLTTASVVMSADNNTATVKFNVQTTDLDNDKTTGAVSVTEENKNKLVSAENIANAINKATSSLSSSLAFRGDNNPTVGVDVADDTNTKVDLKKQALKVLGTSSYVTTKATGQTLTIDLDSDLKEKLNNLPDNVNKSLQNINDKIGTAPADAPNAQTSPAGDDGLNGKSLTEQIHALRDGLAGNVVYTNQDGERLVKGSDGKYYVAEKVGDKVQGPNGEWYPEGTTFKDGNPIKDGSPATALADADKPKEVAKDSIVSTTVNPDGSTKNPVQMGNVKSGLGLDGTGKDGTGTVSSPKAITAQQAKDALNGKDGKTGLLAMEGANNLNKVATVGDLQALAQAGLDFNGNNTKAVVHRPLGTKLEIVGDNSATDFASAVGNINVFGDPANNKLVIQLSKVLTNITSIGGGFKDSVTDKTSTKPEDQKAQLTFNDDDLALNNKTLSGVKSAIKPATQDKTMLDHLKEAAKDKGSSVVNVEDLAGVTTALETKLETELTNKGLSFGGDSGKAVSRKLGEKLNVKGGVTNSENLTNNNIGVVTDPDNNALIVKLAKDISAISSITTEKKDGQSATFNSEGIKITGSDNKNGQSASYGLGGTTLTNGENKAELKPESLTFSDATNPDGAKSSLSKDSLNFTKEDGSKGISVNGKDGTISNLAERTLVGKDGNGPLNSDYGTGNNRNNAATEGALKDLADKLGVSTPNTLPIDSATGPSGADGLNGKSVLDKIQALRDGAAGNLVYTDSEGKRLVKGSDGKYYVAEKVGDKVQGPDDKWYPEGTTFKDGKPIAKDGSSATALADTEIPKEVAKDSIVSTTVNPDGSTTSPVQMGNVKSGLGLDKTATPIAADAAKKAIIGEDGKSGLLTQSGASLNKVATVGDLQALAQAGLNFVGNNEENVHRPLGTQLKVVGDGVDAAKAKDFESATGNINVKSNATENSLTVQLAKDLKNLTSSEFKDAKGNTTTVNGEGITITPPAKSVVSLTSEGLNNGGNKITNLAKGENDGDAVTIAQLKELTKAVTGSSDINIENKKVNKNNKGLDDGTIFEGEPNGKDVFVEGGKPVLKTYNVSEQKEYLTNSVYTAISNMNEQGIKFFHTNDGKTQQTNQASNTEDSSASGAYSTAIGYQSSAEGENSLAIGSGSVVKGKNSIVIGSEGSVHGSDSISVGTGNEVFGNNSGAFGDPSIINAKSSYLVGNNSTLGAGDDLTKLVEERKALTRPTRPRKLEAKGATESDQDYQNRVNAYLEKMAEYNTALADYMEKREAINEKITALSEKTQGVMAMGNDVTVTQGSNGALVMGSNSYVNVVNSGLDTNIQGIAIGNNTRVDTNASSVALGSGAHALQSLEALQAATVYAHEQAVGKGSEVIGEVSFGKEGEYRRLTNIAAGATDTDAVNVSQLKGVASNINQQLNNLSQNISGVAASSAAMANLPQAYLPGKSMVAVSTGYHKGQSAIALGVSRVADNGKLIIKASASHNTQNDFTGGIGVGYQW